MDSTRLTARLGLAVLPLVVFALVAQGLLRVLPGPHRQVDYMVAGTVATMVALFTLFVALNRVAFRGTEIFFKRRKGE